MVVLICAIDLLMARFITKPVSELNEAAKNLAELDFSKPCKVTSLNEFGELSESLNKMAENLQQAFVSLEDANLKLEQDVEQKKRLLAERKELVDNLSHEMKTPLGVIRAYTEGLQDETDEGKRQKYLLVSINNFSLEPEVREKMNSLVETIPTVTMETLHMVKGNNQIFLLSFRENDPYLLVQNCDAKYWESMHEKNLIIRGRVPKAPGEIVVGKNFLRIILPSKSVIPLI